MHCNDTTKMIVFTAKFTVSHQKRQRGGAANFCINY